jgi:carbamoyltransferase
MRWSGNTLKFLNHHECHSAFSFYQSPFSNANIVSIDGRGEEETLTISKASDKTIKKILSIKFLTLLDCFTQLLLIFLVSK